MPHPSDPLQDWLDGARDLALPFDLPLADGTSVRCEQLLRIVPGRRWVLRARWQGEPVLAKVFLADERLPLRQQRENSGYQALQQASVLSPAIVLQCLAACGRVGVSLHAWLEDAVPVSRAWADVRRRPHWMNELGRVVGAMHRAGLCQHDIHLDNFLCVGDQLWVIDAGSIEQRVAPLPEQASVHNLALLLAQWPLDEHMGLRPLADRYMQERRLPILPEVLEAATLKAWRQRTRHFLDKAQRECSQFAVQAQRDAWAIWKRDRSGSDLQAFIANPDAFMESADILKAGNSATVVRAVMDDREVVIKRYNIKDRKRLLRRAFKRSRARNAWLSAWLLSYAGIPTPRPVCLLEHRRFGMNTRAWLVTDAVAGDLLDSRHLQDQPARQAALAAIVRTMAAAGISHGDMKATNFMVQDQQLCLIDLDAMRWHSSLRAAHNALKRDVDRFLRNWRDKPAVQQQLAGVLQPWR